MTSMSAAYATHRLRAGSTFGSHDSVISAESTMTPSSNAVQMNVRMMAVDTGDSTKVRIAMA
jgi:hypothetical protein